jgi:negative regulator of replication initiation
MQLTNIIEREGNKLKIIEVDGERYHSTVYAAKQIGVSRATLLRWMKMGEIDYQGGEKLILNAIVDPMSGHKYLKETDVEKLKPENRFMQV